MTSILIGATGLTGSFLLRQLLADTAITQIISISRKPSQLTNPKLTELLITDLSELPSLAPQIPTDALFFSCLGTTIKAAGTKLNFEKVDHTAILAFAQIAQARGAKSFTLVSAMGANARSAIFYNQIKGRTENDIKSLALKSLIIFRPALLVGPRQEFRQAEVIAAKTLVPFAHLLPTPIQKRLITPAETLATRMLTEAKAAPAAIRIIPAKDI